MPEADETAAATQAHPASNEAVSRINKTYEVRLGLF